MDKKYFPQVYLEECRYKVKKIQLSKFKNAELESDSDSESDLDLDLNSKNILILNKIMNNLLVLIAAKQVL